MLILHKFLMHVLATSTVLFLVACGGGGQSPSSLNSTAKANAEQLVDSIIVKPASQSILNAYETRASEFASTLSFNNEAGVVFTPKRQMFGGGHVLSLSKSMSLEQAQELANSLSRRADVAYAEPERVFQAMLIPNERLFSEQWHSREASVAAGGANLLDAWDITTGDPQLVMAVVDTGVLPHIDFANRLLPGYDFISNISSANDGNGRDSNAVDSGDWLTTSEASRQGRTARASTWHGTHVAGIMGAVGNNGLGVAGVNWRSKLLPLRVLGKYGGTTSDIADAVAWAAGANVPGTPANLNPARVINLSLGGFGACSRSMQDAINAANSRSAVVVVAAGNENSNVTNVEPANCNGVITVASVGQAGNRAPYSNFGSRITLAAPGGDMRNDAGVISLGDDGQTTARNNGSTVAKQGTSMAAPHVAGIVSLILSVNPNLTPDQVKSILTATARPFPAGSSCTTNQCGSGIVNASAALRAAAGGGAQITSNLPQSGWWWHEREDGRGFAIEVRDGKLFFAGFMYGSDGKPTWYASGPAAMQTPNNYVGTLDTYSGGQTLNGNHKPPTQGTSAGQIKIDFNSPQTGTITWPGGVIPIKRFEFSASGLTTPRTAFTPESGWWWNTKEDGRGYALEVQNGRLFMAAFMYSDTGNPVWFVTTGSMSSPTKYSGSWVQYENGQTLTGSHRLPSISNSNVGSVNIEFTSTSNAQLTLPNGRVIALERFGIGFQSPVSMTSPNRLKTAQLVGAWGISYTIISTFTDNFIFNEVRESPTKPGVYNVWGFNQYDSVALGGWDPDFEQFSILAPGIQFDDFYWFSMPIPSSMSGCYYLAFRNPTRLSNCYALNGLKTAEVNPLHLGPLPRSLADSEERANLLLKQDNLSARRNILSPSAQVNSPNDAPTLARKPEIDHLIRYIEQMRATQR
jgi:serine protease